MTAPVVKGWCPGALRPMASGDGVLVRVRPPAGRLTQAQAAGIARLAGRYGNGLIDLSTRANIQLRGVRDHTYDPLMVELSELGLIDPTPEAEAKRNIVTTPYWLEGDGTLELAHNLARALQCWEGTMPSKFGFAIDTGPAPVLRNISADIRTERTSNGELLCRADGASHGALVTPETMASTALDLARWFLAGGKQGRMAARLSEGAVPPSVFSMQSAVAADALPPPRPGRTVAGMMVGFAFGQMQAHTLAVLAGIGPLRVTPWRMLLVEGLADIPAIEHVLTQQEDPLLRVVACPGAPACVQGLQPTRALARHLAPQVPVNAVLHVSGCAKSCAHPGATPLTLMAQASGFDLIHNGSAKAENNRHVTAEHLMATPEILLEGLDASLL